MISPNTNQSAIENRNPRYAENCILSLQLGIAAVSLQRSFLVRWERFNEIGALGRFTPILDKETGPFGVGSGFFSRRC
jgi:hypothetical protein